MNELPQSEFSSVSALFAPLEYHLAIPAVLHGQSPGQIWVDDLERPRVALLCRGHRLYLAGNPALSEAVQRLFEKTLVPAARDAGQWGFLLDCEAGWEEHLETVLPAGLKRNRYPRIYLELALSHPPPSDIPLPKGFRLAQVNRELVEDKTIENLGELLEEMCSERPSVEDFLAKSFGVCLLHQNTVAGWCLSEYNLGERCEVGIATAEAFRKQGLATLQGQAFLALAYQRGIRRVGWHCWAGNLGSVNTALRLGFARLEDYPCWVLEF